MEFWSRLIGYTPREPPSKASLNDPQARLHRLQKVYNSVLELCNRPRDLANERPLLQKLGSHIERTATLLREESRAPVPHVCLQYASSNQIYTVIARVAIVSQDATLIQSSIAVFAALIDSEEEGFLSSAPFAKSLMRLVTRLVDAGNILDIGTETTILELLFTISAKIRLQPDILPVWFHSTNRNVNVDVFGPEKSSFLGITAKEDFPLCYLLVDRVHHEGRIGDFARTGLLYIFEATGRSADLEQWVISSDLPTLMATGLGALYSQLSRELSILHVDANLPAVLAMSDYSTTSPHTTAESAFSERHKAHMSTFLSYLAFWQDILDHCRSAEVKQTLLDHFQILFLQQLLYPSLLQSSDTDAGSSVAVLTYMTAMLEALEYPELVNNMLDYLMAVQDQNIGVPSTPATPSKPPRSPSTLVRRESLLALNAPKDPEHVVDPDLFNLVDLIINNVKSKNSQSAFAALRLVTAVVTRQKKYALGTLLKVQHVRSARPTRIVGALQVELDRYTDIAVSLHGQFDLAATYHGLIGDVRSIIEAQLPTQAANLDASLDAEATCGLFSLPVDDPLMRAMTSLLRTFLTNSIDVNLAVTQAFVSIALCVQIRLEDWVCLHPKCYVFEQPLAPARAWQSNLDEEEQAAWSALQEVSRPPMWPESNPPMLFEVLQALASELDGLRTTIPNLEELVAGRKIMLQAYSSDEVSSETLSLMTPATQTTFLKTPKALNPHSRNPSVSSSDPLRENKATSHAASPHSTSSAASPIPTSNTTSLFRPPPPEAPSTTDVLMQKITLPVVEENVGDRTEESPSSERIASLNHVLTNVVVLQEFVLEIIAVAQMRTAVLHDREVKME